MLKGSAPAGAPHPVDGLGASSSPVHGTSFPPVTFTLQLIRRTACRLPRPGRLGRLACALLLAWLSGGLWGRAGTLGAQPAPLPRPVGYVNDFANVLEADVEARLDDLIRRVQAATKGEIVVVTLPSLDGRPVEEVSLRLGREWKVGADAAIGDSARNAGVVVLVVPKETADDGRGRCRIEVGQGAEGFLTDGMTGALCREQTPQFRERAYGAAVEGIVTQVASRYAQAFGVTLEGVPVPSAPSSGNDDGGSFAFVLFIVILFFVFSSMGHRRRGCGGCVPIPVPTGHRGWHGGGWSSGGGFGGSSGGFGGFGGGGGFSGGGGGSDW